MTLDEAISHCRKKANEHRKEYARFNDLQYLELAQKCLSCFNEHEQLRRWLEELKRYRGNSGVIKNNNEVIIRWNDVNERLPNYAGEYLVAYHPCRWDDVDLNRIEVGLDTFRGKKTWSKNKFQKVIAWAEKPQLSLN